MRAEHPAAQNWCSDRRVRLRRVRKLKGRAHGSGYVTEGGVLQAPSVHIFSVAKRCVRFRRSDAAEPSIFTRSYSRRPERGSGFVTADRAGGRGNTVASGVAARTHTAIRKECTRDWRLAEKYVAAHSVAEAANNKPHRRVQPVAPPAAAPGARDRHEKRPRSVRAAHRRQQQKDYSVAVGAGRRSKSSILHAKRCRNCG